MPRTRLAVCFAAIGMVAFALANAVVAAGRNVPTAPDGVAGTCDRVNPSYVATVIDWWDPAAKEPARSPAIVLLSDTARNAGGVRTVALLTAVGSVNGLAVDGRRGHIYAGAYFSAWPFGSGGTGAVYRIDMATGRVALFATLGGGVDVEHHPADGYLSAGRYAGKMGLGDVEIDATMSELFVANLHDRKIHRFAVLTGAFLGTFDNGAAGEAWAPNARLMGLGYRDGYLYHGVVDSRERPELPGTFSGHVYRSRDDGSELAEVAVFALDYPRESDWEPWNDAVFAGTPSYDHRQPLISDVEFRPDGTLILGLRDRLSGTSLGRPGGGDALPTHVDVPGRWTVITAPEWYQDNLLTGVTFHGDEEGLYGGLAPFPGRDLVVSTASAPTGKWLEFGAVWFDNATGNILGPADGREPVTDDETPSMGDIEVYCPPDDTIPTATPSPTATPPLTSTPTRSPSATATPTLTDSPTATSTTSATATAPVSPTPPAPPVWTVYLPVGIRRHCAEEARYIDVALVIDASTSMRRETSAGRSKLAAVQDAARTFVGLLRLGADGRRDSDRVAIVAFNDTAWTAQSLTTEGARVAAALDGLPARVAEGTRLDLALAEGTASLAAPNRRAGSLPVMILLTDGLPNRVPTPAPAGSQADAVLEWAARAKADGIRVFAIGVGRADAPDIVDRIDAALLGMVASDPADFYEAPDAEGVGHIYRAIATEFRCPDGEW